MSSAASALVVHDGKLLLQRRAIEPWLGAWCAPGGFCSEGEDAASAAVRETFEEVGLLVEVTGYVGHWVDEYSSGGDDGLDPSYCAVSYFHARVVGDAEPLADGVESSEWGWFGPDELPHPLAPPANAEAIYAAWRESLGRRSGTEPKR